MKILNKLRMLTSSITSDKPGLPREASGYANEDEGTLGVGAAMAQDVTRFKFPDGFRCDILAAREKHSSCVVACID